MATEMDDLDSLFEPLPAASPVGGGEGAGSGDAAVGGAGTGSASPGPEAAPSPVAVAVARLVAMAPGAEATRVTSAVAVFPAGDGATGVTRVVAAHREGRDAEAERPAAPPEAFDPDDDGARGALGLAEAEGGDADDDGGAAEDRPPFSGLSWDVVERILDMRAVDVPWVLRVALAIRATGKTTMSVPALASTIKKTETATLELVSNLPSLFRVTHRNGRVTMHNAPLSPDDLTVDERKRRAAAELQEKRRKDREELQRRKDAEATPFNRLRETIQQAGMGLDAAREFAGYVTRTYGFDAAMAAADAARAKKPNDVKAYVLSILKRAATSGVGVGLDGTVRMVERPNHRAGTVVLGWEDREHDGVRHRLLRLPTGRLQRERPEEGLAVPSFADVPGLKVAG